MYFYVHPRFLASSVDYRSSHAFSSCGLGKTREIPVAAREKERKKKGDRETAPDRQRRPIRKTGATRKRIHRRRQWDTESRGARRRGGGIERSYENKAKPEGGVRYAHATIDTQDRRSNFRSCHSDASWRVSPRLLHAFTHTLADERSAKHAPRRAALPGALHIRRDCMSRSCTSLTHGCETRERWMLTRLLRASPRYPRRA